MRECPGVPDHGSAGSGNGGSRHAHRQRYPDGFSRIPEALSQPFIVENPPSAAGAIGCQERMENLDFTPIGGAPGDLDRALRADLGVNRELVTSLGLKVD